MKDLAQLGAAHHRRRMHEKFPVDAIVLVRYAGDPYIGRVASHGRERVYVRFVAPLASGKSAGRRQAIVRAYDIDDAAIRSRNQRRAMVQTLGFIELTRLPCQMCGALAMTELPADLAAQQPDGTTHVCHPLLGGCNHGFTTAAPGDLTKVPTTPDVDPYRHDDKRTHADAAEVVDMIITDEEG